MAADTGPGQACGTGRGQISADRHSNLEQPARRIRRDPGAHPIQQREPAPPHRPDLPLRCLLVGLRKHPRCRAEHREPRLVPGQRRCGPSAHHPPGGHRRYRYRHPVGRPVVLDGPGVVCRPAPRGRRRPDDRRQSRHPGRGTRSRDHANGFGTAHRRIRREATGAFRDRTAPPRCRDGGSHVGADRTRHAPGVDGHLHLQDRGAGRATPGASG